MTAMRLWLVGSAAVAALAQVLPLLAQQNPPQGHHEHLEHLDQQSQKGQLQQNQPHHNHAIGPAGATYDLRWLDAMVQHHTGALRMSEVVFDVGAAGVGALAKTIWDTQAQEIKAMGQWRKAWYPEAPVYPVVLRSGGDPNRIDDLERMSQAQIAAMQMTGAAPTRSSRITWFLEGMLEHHGGALLMARDALAHSSNTTLQRMAQQIILSQRREIQQLRRMLIHDGLNKPQYYRFN